MRPSRPVDASTGPPVIPDLLDETASLRIDPVAAHQVLAFAFASGSPASAFEQLMASASPISSGWNPAAFADDLFVAEFVARCMKVVIGGRAYAIDHAQLERTLCRPPERRATVEFRRAIARELADSPALRAELERLYETIHRLRSQLESPAVIRRLGAHRRRLEILATLKEVLSLAAESFASARSGLTRVRAFGRAVAESTAYARLADLLDYDDHLAVLDLRIRLGQDGRVRGLELLAAKENEKNRFHASPFSRFWTRLRLALFGYRIEAAEALARAVDQVFDGLEPAVLALLQLQMDLEFYLGGLALRDLAERSGLAVCLPELIGSGRHDEHDREPSAPSGDTTPAPPSRELRALFNPLLVAAGQRVVAGDFTTDRHRSTVIVTGPNSGGKTRLLQAIALTQLLGQSGLYVPAASARLLWAHGLYVSLIERVQADQTEGRLGTELLRIRSLFESLPLGAMVVVDELCSGTNPSEGEEMFELVISLLAELEPQAFVTTHFLHLAQKLAVRPPVLHLDFFQVELDADQWPTFRFVPGVAETSLAHRTAARLGVTRDELLALIRRTKDAAGGLSC